MKILNTDLRFKRPLARRRETSRIVIHHSASAGNETAAVIHGWHRDRGWNGIGYHYVIRKDGTIERGRPEEMVGAHAGRQGNWNSIGICVDGHFSKNEPPQIQIKALVWLVNDIKNRHKKAKVVRHRDIGSTECPGVLFPWGELKGLLNKTKIPTAVKLTINDRPTTVPLRIVAGRTEAKLSGHWVQLRDLANLLQAEIGWNPETRTVNFKIK